MSKIIPYAQYPHKDSYYVTAASITTGWLPGQIMNFNSTGQQVQLCGGTNPLFFAMDATTELAAPPSGSLVTVLSGFDTKFVIDHSAEVAAGSATRAYETVVESASMNAPLYCSANSKITTVSSGSVIGVLYQIPAADNNYSAGVISRI
jgi:hypothetical protein